MLGVIYGFQQCVCVWEKESQRRSMMNGSDPRCSHAGALSPSFFGDPTASLITRYRGNSGLPRVCAPLSCVGVVSECGLWLILLSSQWLSSHSCLGNTHPRPLPHCLSLLPHPVAPLLISLHHPQSFPTLFCSNTQSLVWVTVLLNIIHESNVSLLLCCCFLGCDSHWWECYLQSCSWIDKWFL